MNVSDGIVCLVSTIQSLKYILSEISHVFVAQFRNVNETGSKALTLTVVMRNFNSYALRYE